LDSVRDQCHRLDGWMHRQFFRPPGAHGVDAGMVPHVRPMAPKLAKFEIVDVGCGPPLPDKHQLVLGAIERAHSGVALVPDTEVLELAVDLVTGAEHLSHVAPIHADLMDRTVDSVLGEQGKDGFEKGCEFRLAHLATAHGEVAMTNAAQAADM